MRTTALPLGGSVVEFVANADVGGGVIDTARVPLATAQGSLGITGLTDQVADLAGQVEGFGLLFEFTAGVDAATTGTLPANTYANGTAGVGATLTGNANGALAAQDGVTLTANQSLWVKNEAAPANNGIYTLTTVGDGSHPFVLTRRADANTSALLGKIAATVLGGVSANNGRAYSIQLAADAIVVGTTALNPVVVPTGGAVATETARAEAAEATKVSILSPGAKGQLEAVVDDAGTLGQIDAQSLLAPPAPFTYDFTALAGYQSMSGASETGFYTLAATSTTLTWTQTTTSNQAWIGATLSTKVAPGLTVLADGVGTITLGNDFNSGLAIGVAAAAPTGGAFSNRGALGAGFVGVECQGGNAVAAYDQTLTVAAGVSITNVVGSTAWTTGQALSLSITFDLDDVTRAAGAFSVAGTEVCTFNLAGLPASGWIWVGFKAAVVVANTVAVSSVQITKAVGLLNPLNLVTTPLPAGSSATASLSIVGGQPTLALGLVQGGGAGVAISIAQRDPKSTDDTTLGFAVYPASQSSWLNQASGALFQCLRNTAAKAVWTPIAGAAPLPLDAVPTAAAAYGVTRLRAAYSGHAFQIKRLSDNTTLDVGFVGNVADWAAADTFCAGSAAVFSKAYDQAGAGLDALAGTNPPAFTFNNTVNGFRCISFGTNANNYQSFSLPSGLVLTRNACSVAMAMISPGAATGTTSYFVAGTDVSSLNNLILLSGNSGKFQVAANTQPVLFNADAEPTALVLSSGASALTLYANEQSQAAGAALTAASLVGGAIGLYTGFHLEGDLLSMIVYGRALTATEAAALKQAMYRQYGMAPQLVDRLICPGDSITAGANADYSQPWSRQLRPLLIRPYRIYNQGVSGETAAWFDTNYTTEIAPCFVGATGRVTVVFSLGTNDIALGSSAAAIHASLTSLVGKARASGAYSVGVATVLPRSNTPLSGGGAAQEAVRAVLNPLILADLCGADFVADIGGDAVMGPYAAASNATLYFGGLHPTALGQSHTAPVYAAGLNVWG